MSADPDIQQPLQETDPRIQRDIEVVLAGGKVTKSYEGTSQYAQKGISACGLASCNAVRLVLGLEEDGVTGLELVRRMMSLQLIERTTRICASWTSPAHLEVEDILVLPLFSRDLKLLGTEYDQCSYAKYLVLFRHLKSLSNQKGSTAAVVTKPPEIVTLFAIATHLPSPQPETIFAIFDSHSRPTQHPNGAGMTFFVHPTSAAGYLSRLWEVDPALTAEADGNWQTQLLVQYSAHILKNSPDRIIARGLAREELEVQMMEATKAVLSVKSQLADLESKYVSSAQQVARLEEELHTVRNELHAAQKTIRRSDRDRDRDRDRPRDRDRDRERERERERERGKERPKENEQEKERERRKLAPIDELDEKDPRSAAARRKSTYEDVVSWGGDDDFGFSLLDYAPSFITTMLSRSAPADYYYRPSRSTRSADPASSRPARERPSHRHRTAPEPPIEPPVPQPSSSRQWERERERDRERDKDRDKGKGKERERDKDRDREKEKEKEREREKERDRVRDSEKERERAKTRERERDKPRERDAPPEPRQEPRERRSSSRPADLARDAEPRDHHRKHSLRRVSSSRTKRKEDQDALLADQLQTQLIIEDTLRAKPLKPKLTFECGICFQECPVSIEMKLEGCDHSFCRDCLESHIISSLEMNRFPILCPVCMVDNEPGREQGVVTLPVIQRSGVDEKYVNRWTDLDLAKFSVLLDCRKCRQSVLVDRDDYTTTAIISCPLKGCDSRWCKECLQPVDSDSPQDHSCDGTKEIDRLIGREGWKRCPGCQIPTERTEGCNHMTCQAPGCNTHFCYIDGALIVTTQNSGVAKTAVDAHYRTCRLFDIPAELIPDMDPNQGE